MLRENYFWSKFCLKTSNFLFENYRLAEKKGWRSWGHVKNFEGGEQKPSVTNLKCKHLATWLLYTLISEFPWRRYDCSVLCPCSMFHYIYKWSDQMLFRQHCLNVFLCNIVWSLETTLHRVFPVHYCPRSIKITLCRTFSSVMLCGAPETTLYRV